MEKVNAQKEIRIEGDIPVDLPLANGKRLLAALLERGHNASQVDLPLSTYDIVVEKNPRDIIRVQVKTVSTSGSVNFKGGVRGGVDRTYKSDEKEYVQNTETSDVVVGVKSIKSNGDRQIDYYFIPTILIERLGQKSLSINKIPQAKNKWDILSNCKDHDFVARTFSNFYKPL